MSFGKGSSGGTNTVTNSGPPAYVQPYLTQAAQAAQGIYNQGTPAIDTAQNYAPINSTQQQALDQTLAYGAQGPNQATTTGINTLEGVANSNPDPMQNPYLANLVQQQGLNANQIVAGNFNQGGRYGSGAQAAAAGTAITNAQLPTLAAQYNTNMNNKITAAGQLPNLATTQNSQQLSQAQATGTVGDAYAQQAQDAINQAQQIYNYNNGGGANAALNQYLQELGLATTGQSSSQTTQNNPMGIGGQIGSIASGLGSLSGLSGGLGTGLSSILGATGMGGGTMSTIASALMAFSDERLKKNIVSVGTENGHNVYEFEYIGGTGQCYSGVMAQEVIKTHPEAIIMDKSGYMAVDYSKIGVNFKEVGEKSPSSSHAPASLGGQIEAGVLALLQGCQ